MKNSNTSQKNVIDSDACVPSFNNKSLVAIPIEMGFSTTGQHLGAATAFFYQKSDSLFLITNWHVVTDINPLTKQPVAYHGGRPDTLTYRLYSQNDFEFSFNYFTVKLYSDEKMEIPKWLIHPKYKAQVDVVALEIDKPEGNLRCLAINDNELSFKEFDAVAADEVFILGYPYNIKQSGVFPVWKRASIATEPEFDYKDLPIILVDTASRKGMSGAPAILQRNSVWGTPEPGIGRRHCFLGVYSGRITGETELEAQLGIVWKRQVIDEIIVGKTKDSLDNFN